MVKRVLPVTNRLGIHARPAGMIVDITTHAKSDVQIHYGDLRANAKSILNVMMLAAEPGSEVTFVIEGEDEERVADELQKLFENRFNED
ncbi:MAG: HPr family phosphocarrier protein [Fibrobacterales bacterium]|nr:HPr family phosphocarrier protein [Fibrobacterales bacterium]MBP5188013.1 HPr family phosphocarrier protein [Fibrobacterales bacterium]MBP5351478.1 HPr family phosphocarrier protein [Fibrobacterales bacterium]